MRKIEKLETETSSKQTTLDQLRREKVQLENTLEQEQEGMFYYPIVFEGRYGIVADLPPNAAEDFDASHK